ncbi:MAG: carboxypeptidase M32 [Pyrinomonadaceae bacterium MAG19_C2-C3]|nr:carboxypeptidase M32 [Pyrinomonadaceae bacterium MAG19_C2-C3]
MKTSTVAWHELKSRLARIYDFHSAAGLLIWDQQTNMPPGGVPARAEALATLSTVAHEHLVDDETRCLLDTIGDDFDATTEDAALVRLVRRDYERATKLPVRLVADFSRATTLAEPAWVAARARSDWAAFAPHLERILTLQQEAAEYIGYTTHPYDALLDTFEPGATKLELETVFDELKTPLIALVARINDAQTSAENEKRDAPLYGDFDEAKQEAFGREIVERFGYDFRRGRQDRAVHPFCISFGNGDVRITTRFDREWLSPALFGTLHESGHALYEQGIDSKYARTPAANGCSMGVHESQSRLWENIVGRSLPFWQFFYPRLQAAFPEHFSGIELARFYRAINTVERTPIRVEADEVTYNLHVLVRFEIEVALFENRLKVADLPAAWNEKMRDYLGITPATDAEGALQDIHWANGSFAYFPTYTVGNVLAVQLYDTALATHPSITDEITRGEFATLHGWLAENIYRHGKRYEPAPLIERATGKPLNTAPYLRYLHTKFGELYDLKTTTLTG